MKAILTFMLIATFKLAAFPQSAQKTETDERIKSQMYSYAYISVEGKIFSKKLRVEVDLGDSPEQIMAGKEYSQKLTDKKSYAAVLNYMVESQFELVETLDYTYNYQGSGGTYGVVFIMRKKIAG